jgi:hypothetical protein
MLPTLSCRKNQRNPLQKKKKRKKKKTKKIEKLNPQEELTPFSAIVTAAKEEIRLLWMPLL